MQYHTTQPFEAGWQSAELLSDVLFVRTALPTLSHNSGQRVAEIVGDSGFGSGIVILDLIMALGKVGVLCMCVLATATAFLPAPRPTLSPHHAPGGSLSSTTSATAVRRCSLSPRPTYYRSVVPVDAPRRGTGSLRSTIIANVTRPPLPLQVSTSQDQAVADHSGLSADPQLHRNLPTTPVAGGNRRIALTVASALAAGLAVAAFAPQTAVAAASKASDFVNGGTAASAEHLHVGQKIANFFRRGGLPDWATLMTISAMPVVELRGGVPVGLWMGMPILKTFALCVTGNMIPIPIILLALRSQFVQKLAKPILDRAREKAEGFGDEKSQALALTLFVGIPLPGTGAWTGAMGAFLLGMPFGKVRGDWLATSMCRTIDSANVVF